MNYDAMTVDEIWNYVLENANANKEAIKDFDVSYGFEISGDESGSYTLNLKQGEATLNEGAEETDCLLQMNNKNFKKLIAGNLNATSAFMTGRLKVKGNIGLALKLEKLLKEYF